MKRRMKKKGRKIKEGKRIKQILIAALIAAAFVAPAFAAPTLTVTPSECISGDLVTLRGTGFDASEIVTLTSTCTCWKPVIEGQTECCLLKFNISNKKTGFSLVVHDVKDNVTIDLKKFWGIPFWHINHNMLGFKFTYDPVNHTSKVVRPAPIPTGVYEVIDVIGKPIDGVCEVEMVTTVTTEVTTDGTGRFREVVDTHGIPAPKAGKYTVKAIGKTSGLSATSDLKVKLKGDVSRDGIVGAYDCVSIARYSVGLPGYNAQTLNLDLYTADVCCFYQGEVDIDDARWLARYLVGLETKLC